MSRGEPSDGTCSGQSITNPSPHPSVVQPRRLDIPANKGSIRTMADSDAQRPLTPAASGSDVASYRPGFPKLFIGSSTPQLAFSRALKKQLEVLADVTLWCDDGVLVQPRPPIEDLLEWTSKVDYAVLVFGADDTVASRSDRSWQTRDEVALTLGLFVARLGRKRVFYLAPDSERWERLSDLLDIAPIVYRRLEGEPASEDVLAAAERVGEAIRTTWRPVPPVLFDRYNDLKRRLRETSRMALARRCESSGKPVPDCLSEEDVYAALVKVLSTEAVPMVLSDAFHFLSASTAEVASSTRGQEWERRLHAVLDHLEQSVAQSEKWVRDEPAWERLESYFVQMSRYEVLAARVRMAAAAIARLLVAATNVTPPVDITEESAQDVLAHLAERTDVAIGMPSLHETRPRYVWPDDRSGYRVETALDPLQKDVTRLESFASSDRTPGLLAECHALLTRYKKTLLVALVELHEETPSRPVAPPPTTSLSRIEMYYLAGKGYLRDSRLRAPRLHGMQYLGEMLQRPDGSDGWQVEFRSRMDILAAELTAYEEWHLALGTTVRSARQ